MAKWRHCYINTENIDAKIKAKEKIINEYTEKIKETKAYIEGLKEAINLLNDEEKEEQ